MKAIFIWHWTKLLDFLRSKDSNMSDTYIQPTKEELEIIQKFIDSHTKRHNKLIEMNQQIKDVVFNQEVHDLRQQMIKVMEYSRDKTIEIFEDYKTGRVPVPFGVGFIQKQ